MLKDETVVSSWGGQIYINGWKKRLAETEDSVGIAEG
jgi:hypothetical protein